MCRWFRHTVGPRLILDRFDIEIVGVMEIVAEHRDDSRVATD